MNHTGKFQNRSCIVNMKEKMPRSKLKSKLERLKIRDDIAEFLKKLPLKDMKESQIGNHVYSAAGKIRVGTSYKPTVMRIRIVDEEIIVFISIPSDNVLIRCPFEPGESAKTVLESLKKALN